MDRTPAHLSPAPTPAVLIAWHRMLDVASWRVDSGEILMVYGKPVAATHPTQTVVELCRLSEAKARAAIRNMVNATRAAS